MIKKVRGSTSITLNIDFEGEVEVRPGDKEFSESPRLKYMTFEGQHHVQSQQLDDLKVCEDKLTGEKFFAIPIDLLDMEVIEHLERKHNDR